MLYNILLIVQVLVSIGIITLVLMQHGKGADAGAAFGSGASGTVFGSQGSANFLSRATAVLATVFFVNSLALAYIVAGQNTDSTSLMEGEVATEVVAPVEPANPEVPAAPVTSNEVPSAPAENAEVPAVAPAEQPAAEVPQAPVAQETTEQKQQ